MAVFYRFIRNLKVAIKDKERYLSNQGKRDGRSVSSKIKIRDTPSTLSECIPKQTVLKELLRNFDKIKVCSGVCIFKMVKMYSFTGALNHFQSNLK